jgi:hypothetical protein
MRRLLILLILVSFGLEAQTVIRAKRRVQANIDTVRAGDFYVGEFVFTTDTYRLYIGTASGVVRVGVDSAGYYGSDIIPSTDGLYDLGSVVLRFDTAYVITPRFGGLSPDRHIKVVPGETIPPTTHSFTNADTVDVFVYAFELQNPARFIGIGVATGTLTGAQPYRSFNFGVYDTSGAILSQCQSAGHQANTVQVLGLRGPTQSGTQDTLELDPGLYYMAFSTWISSGNTAVWKGADLSATSNSWASLWLDGEMDGGLVWSGVAANVSTWNPGTEVLTMPATLGTITKHTLASNPRFPWAVLIPLGVGPPTQ